jgi:serine/threonine protein kinase/Tfp pilus assembly protein PilF
VALPSHRLAAIDRVFGAALDLEPAQRDAYLDQACAGDPELRDEVERLLDLASREVDGVMAPVARFVAEVAASAGAPGGSAPPASPAPPSLDPSELAGPDPAASSQGPARGLAFEPPTLMGADARPTIERALAAAARRAHDELGPGDTIGPYRVLGTLGRGGMAVVYQAERTAAGFSQQVAIKRLPATHSAAVIRRFEQERQILARLDHPHIARLFDGGIDQHGRPYLVMEQVIGEPIDVWCDRRRASLPARIALLATVADAVQSAHQSLVVHRDLKPSNLLVSERGDPKLLDFGIAKLLGDDDPDLRLTVTDARPMTPTYASPEQITGQPITTATDVYQLGLLLYELLTGRRPQGDQPASLASLVQTICEREAPPPSRVVLQPTAATSAEELAARRQSTPSRLARSLRGELDAIIAKALAKDPRQRYSSAAELAADLGRYLGGLPVLARSGGGWYRLRKFLRRHAAAAAAATAALLLTVSYAVHATLQANALRHERNRSAVAAQKAASVERFVLDLFRVADPSVSRGEAITARELLERGVTRVDDELAAVPEVQARMLSTLAHLHGQLGLFARGETLATRALALQRQLAAVPESGGPGGVAAALAAGGEPLEPLRCELAETLHRYAWLLRQQGRHGEAVAPLREAVTLREALLPGSAELAQSLTELGNLQLQMGDDRAAETSFRASAEIRRQQGDRAGLAASQESLGNLLTARGEHVAAEPLHREALAINRALHGERHPTIASNLFNIGLALQGQGRYDEAEPLFREVLAIDRALYGDHHPEVGIDWMLVGNNAQVRGDLAAAEEAFVTALAILEATVPADHPRRIEALQGVGQLRMAQGRLAEAEQLLRRAVEARSARLGADHPQVALILYPLGQCLVAAGRLEEAREIWTRALSMARGREAALTGRLERDLATLGERLAGRAPATAGAGGAP